MLELHTTPNVNKQPSLRNGNGYQTPKITNTITETIEEFEQLLKSSNKATTNGNSTNLNNNRQIQTTPIIQTNATTANNNNTNSRIKTAVVAAPAKPVATTTLNDLTSSEHYLVDTSTNNANAVTNRNHQARPQSETVSLIADEITPIIITGAPEITKSLAHANGSNGVPHRVTSMLVNEQHYITNKQIKSMCLCSALFLAYSFCSSSFS